MWANLPTDLQDIAKAARRYQPGACAAAFDHHVGGHGGAMADEADFGRAQWQVGNKDRRPVSIASDGSAGVDGDLEVSQFAGRGVVEGEVGERASDVEANTVHSATLRAAGAALKPVRPRPLQDFGRGG